MLISALGRKTAAALCARKAIVSGPSPTARVHGLSWQADHSGAAAPFPSPTQRRPFVRPALPSVSTASNSASERASGRASAHTLGEREEERERERSKEQPLKRCLAASVLPVMQQRSRPGVGWSTGADGGDWRPSKGTKARGRPSHELQVHGG